MNSSRTIVMLIVTAMIMLLINSTQSMPTRQKRWPFNTWGLHDHQKSHYPAVNPTTESYFPQDSADANYEDRPLNGNNDTADDHAYEMLFGLLQFFQTLEREEKEKNDGIKYF